MASCSQNRSESSITETSTKQGCWEAVDAPVFMCTTLRDTDRNVFVCFMHLLIRVWACNPCNYRDLFVQSEDIFEMQLRASSHIQAANVKLLKLGHLRGTKPEH